MAPKKSASRPPASKAAPRAGAKKPNTQRAYTRDPAEQSKSMSLAPGRAKAANDYFYKEGAKTRKTKPR